MTMTYDGALVMPSSYAVMDEEEMCYTVGCGWSTYKGVEALATITAICGAGYVAYGLSVAAATVLVASASTGVGLIIALGLACGVTLSLVASAYQYGLAICAATNMISSYKKKKSFNKSGFKACSYSAWAVTVYTQVASL